jgi:hypothetical protein
MSSKPTSGPECARIAMMPNTFCRIDLRTQRILNSIQVGVPVAFFERGLFRFLKTFALLVGWAVPPIPLNGAEIMRQDWQQYTVPSEASRYSGTISSE